MPAARVVKVNVNAIRGLWEKEHPTARTADLATYQQLSHMLAHFDIFHSLTFRTELWICRTELWWSIQIFKGEEKHHRRVILTILLTKRFVVSSSVKNPLIR